MVERRNLACRGQVLTAAGDSCSGPLSDSDKGETMIDTVLHGSRRIPIYWKTKRTSSGALAGGDSLWTMPICLAASRGWGLGMHRTFPEILSELMILSCLPSGPVRECDTDDL
jgi:hypothetical protein